MKNVVLHFAPSPCVSRYTAAPRPDLQLEGKTALVTGSTAGIGYATAKALLKEGAQVIINARTQESVDKALASLKEATGRTPLSFVGDMSKAEDAARLVKAFPDVDILVNNVGRFFERVLADDRSDWYERTSST
jgi:NAD(P)-dependent dehydrogenase (short-subunit alcohol dehydrogenase family)